MGSLRVFTGPALPWPIMFLGHHMMSLCITWQVTPVPWKITRAWLKWPLGMQPSIGLCVHNVCIICMYVRMYVCMYACMYRSCKWLPKGVIKGQGSPPLVSRVTSTIKIAGAKHIITLFHTTIPLPKADLRPRIPRSFLRVPRFTVLQGCAILTKVAGQVTQL